MDKYYLLTYTGIGEDGFLHSYHAWFETEEELCRFVKKRKSRDKDTEIDLAIEIYRCRKINLVL